MTTGRTGNLVPIGRSSPICRLTITALRHYDDLGLLKPALVDPQSGYRYYSLEQVAAAELIRTLRAVEMPLDEIGAVLRAADPAIAQVALSRHRDRLLERITAQRDAVALLDRFLNREERPMSYTIELTEVPAQQTAGKRLTISPSELGAAIPTAHRATMCVLAGRGIRPSGPPFVIYHDGTPDDDAMTIDVGWPVAEAIAGEGEVQPGTLGGGLAARTTHIGPYDQLSSAWVAVAEWIQSRGHETSGAPWESYCSAPNEPPDPADYRTDIFWPVR